MRVDYGIKKKSANLIAGEYLEFNQSLMLLAFAAFVDASGLRSGVTPAQFFQSVGH